MSEFGFLEFGDTWELHYQGSDANSFLEANSDKYAYFFNLKKINPEILIITSKHSQNLHTHIP